MNALQGSAEDHHIRPQHVQRQGEGARRGDGWEHQRQSVRRVKVQYRLKIANKVNCAAMRPAAVGRKLTEETAGMPRCVRVLYGKLNLARFTN